MKLLFFTVYITCLLFPLSGYSAEFQVQMLSQKANNRMIYTPTVIKVGVGDTVKWVASDEMHNVAFIKGGVPKNVNPFSSRLNEDTEYTFTIPGIYAYKCQPYYGVGMIGFVIVGNDYHNLNRVKGLRYPGKAKVVANTVLKHLG